MKIVVVYPEYVSEFKQCSVEFVIPVGVFDVSETLPSRDPSRISRHHSRDLAKTETRLV